MIDTVWALSLTPTNLAIDKPRYTHRQVTVYIFKNSYKELTVPLQKCLSHWFSITCGQSCVVPPMVAIDNKCYVTELANCAFLGQNTHGFITLGLVVKSSIWFVPSDAFMFSFLFFCLYRTVWLSEWHQDNPEIHGYDKSLLNRNKTHQSVYILIRMRFNKL